GDRGARRSMVRLGHASAGGAADLARRLVRRAPRGGVRRARAQPAPARARARVPDRDRAAPLVARALRRAPPCPDPRPDRLRAGRVRRLRVPRPGVDVLAAALRLLRVAPRAALGDLGRAGPEPRRHPHVDRAGARLLRGRRVAPRDAFPRGGGGGGAAGRGAARRGAAGALNGMTALETAPATI